MQILGISGSLRARSGNSAVIAAAAALAPPGMQVVTYTGLADLPHFNPDLDTQEPPSPVRELRRQVGACQGLILCSPEYARGVAGSLKNALDWLVASVDFPGKPVAIINASASATHADAHLRLTLDTMSACIVPDASITLALLGRNIDAAGILSDGGLSTQLRAALECLARGIQTGPTVPESHSDRLKG
jgi:chromate reductase, NAD(P)H dehydrogenase (quinone)